MPESKIPPVTRSTLPPPEKSVPVPMPSLSDKPPTTSTTAAPAPAKKSPPQTPAPQSVVQKSAPVVPSKLQQGEIEKSLEVAATIAVQEYNKAINILKS